MRPRISRTNLIRATFLSSCSRRSHLCACSLSIFCEHLIKAIGLDRHPEIQELEVNYLLANLGNPELLNELPVWINYLAEGRLPAEATKAISLLISKLVLEPGGEVTVKPPRFTNCNRSGAFYCRPCNRTWQS